MIIEQSQHIIDEISKVFIGKDEIIKKVEPISPYWSDPQARFSTMQTYAITDKKILKI